MHIQIITVGKLKERYLKDGIAEYAKRLGAYARLDLIEVADEKAPERASDTDRDLIKQKEGARILARLPDEAHVIALALDGAVRTSEQFAADLEARMLHGTSRIAFVIGGSLGLHADVLRRADATLSFGAFTFPHQLMKLILIEQVYRAFRIMRGEPYHK